MASWRKFKRAPETLARIARGISKLICTETKVDDSAAGHDLISELPQDIIEVILTKLPIKDAVRTCILSRSWRYKWASMTRILFHQRPRDCKMTHFISGFLSKHNGKIHKFTLYITNDTDAYLHLELCQWLFALWVKDVRELTIRLPYKNTLKVPPCIFSCNKLTRLELHHGALGPPPPCFSGFPCMKHLALESVSITLEGMERLISSCPLLESLTLLYFTVSKLTIRAPNLKLLDMRGRFGHICMENMHLLVDVILVDVPCWKNTQLGFDGDSSSYGSEPLLGGIPKLERLCGRIDAIHGFVKKPFPDYNNDPFSADRTLNQLKLVKNENKEEPFSDYFNDPFLADRKLNQLKLVKIITCNTNEPICVKLIEFLRDRSPSLATTSIEQQN